MCSTKFASQDEVVLIAGAGDWWRCRIFSRDAAARRGLYVPKERRPQPPIFLDIENLDEEVAEAEQDPFNNLVLPHNVPTEAKRIAEKEQQRIAQQRLERAARATVRAQRWEAAEDLHSKAEHMRVTATYPFTDKDINKYWMYRMQEPFMQDGDKGLSLSHKWSLPIRLGTDASRTYLKLIKERLESMATEERARRKTRVVYGG